MILIYIVTNARNFRANNNKYNLDFLGITHYFKLNQLFCLLAIRLVVCSCYEQFHYLFTDLHILLKATLKY